LFDSRVKLKVYERGAGGKADQLLGFTPEHLKKGIRVPSGLWFVRPMGAYKEAQWETLSSDLTRQSVPGLDLGERWDVEDQTLVWLGEALPVRFLQLQHTRVTDDGMTQVSALIHLEILSVSPKTSDAGIKALAPLQHLKELDLRGSRVTENALTHLAAFPHLSILALNQNVTDEGATLLAGLSHISDLDISQTQLGDDGVARLGPLPLESLYMNSRLTDAGLAHINQWPHLRRLDLSRTQVTDPGLANLETLSHLEELALTDTRITDAGIVSLSKLTALKTLELSGTQMTSAGLEFLARLPKLETLSLSWPQLSSLDLKNLARFPKLKTLILDGTPVPQEMLASLESEASKMSFKATQDAGVTPVFTALPTAGMEHGKTTASAPASGVLSENAKVVKNRFQDVGLRRIQRIETEVSELSDVIAISQKPVASDGSQQKDFLGDIDVRVKP